MANNRMFIRHKKTGEIISFGRNSGGQWYCSMGLAPMTEEEYIKEINEFFFKNIDDDVGGKENYELIYESTHVIPIMIPKKSYKLTDNE